MLFVSRFNYRCFGLDAQVQLVDKSVEPEPISHTKLPKLTFSKSIIVTTYTRKGQTRYKVVRRGVIDNGGNGGYRKV